MKQKKRMKEGLIPQDPTLTGDHHNTSPLSQNNTDSNGSLEHPGPLDHAKSESPGPQWHRGGQLDQPNW